MTSTNKLEIIVEIEGVKYYMDTFDDISIPLNYQISDINDIATRRASSSLTITVPETSNNRFIFNSISDLSVDLQYFNPNLKSPVWILANSIQVFRGNLQLTNVHKDLNTNDTRYDVVVYSESDDFFKSIGDSLLTDLDMSNLNHTWGVESITASWYGDWTLGYFYPLIDTNGVVDIRNINGNFQYTTTDGWGNQVQRPSQMEVKGFQPATYIKTIWNKIFDSVGYDYQSDFLKSQTFENLIWPFSGKTLTQNYDFINSMVFNVGKGFDQTINTYSPFTYQGPSMNHWGQVGRYCHEALNFIDESPPIFSDVNGLWSTASAVYTQISATPSHQRFSVDLNITGYGFGTHANVNGSMLKDVSIVFVRSRDANNNVVPGWSQTPTIDQLLKFPRIPLDDVGTDHYSIPYNSPVQDPDNWIKTPMGTGLNGDPIFNWTFTLRTSALDDRVPVNGQFYAPLRQGEEMRIFIVNFANYLTGGSPPYIDPIIIFPGWRILTANAQYSRIYNEIDLTTIPGQPIDYNQIMPENVKQKDFLTSIIKMFNLYIEPNKQLARTLVIEPRDDFYSNGVIKDWSSKLDLMKQIDVKVLAETQNKSTLFTYKPDGDFYNVDYSSRLKRVYGDLRYIIDNDFTSGEKKIDNIFSPTPLSRLENTNAFIIPQVYKLNNGKIQKSDQYNHRILFKKPEGLIGLTASDYWIFEGETQTSYPYAGHFNDPYEPTEDLNWGQSYLYYSNIPTNNNLFKLYWENTMNEICDINSRIITANLYLNFEDIYHFSFMDSIYLIIDGVGGYYRVNKISNFDPTQIKTTQVEFLKMINTPVLNFTPTNNPESTYINLAGSNLTSTINTVSTTSIGTVVKGINNANIGVFNQIDGSGVGVFGGGNVLGTINHINIGDSNIIKADRNGITIGDNNFIGFGSGMLTNGNSNYFNGVVNNSNVFGSNNKVGNVDTQDIFLFGNRNDMTKALNPNLQNVVVFGSDVNLSRSNMFVVQAPLVNTPNLISAGRDEILDPFSDIPINIISAGRDDIRNLGSFSPINIISAGYDTII